MTAAALHERLQRARDAKPRLTDEQRAERRKAIIATASRLHLERGFGGFTVEQLAREAGLSVGAVYLYVPSIGAIYAELLRDDLDAIGDDPEAAVSVLKRYLPAELAEVVSEVGL